MKEKLFIFFPLFLLNIFLYSEWLDFESNWLMYDYEAENLKAGDRVKILWDGKKISGNSLYYDQKSTTVVISGDIVFEDKDFKIKSSELLIDSSGTGILKDAFLHYDKYYLKSREIKRVSKECYILEDSHLSTCDLEEPHYKISAKKIFLYPSVKITAKNAFLKIGKVPVFYFPYWWQSLKKTKWGLRLDIGKSRNQGNFLRSEIYYKLKDNLKVSLLVDYFSKIGAGAGFEGDYNSNNFKTNIWFYNIKTNRKIKYYLWSRYRGFITQSNIEYYSSSRFNFDYFWESPVLYPVRIKSRFGISRNTGIYNFLIYYYREEESDDISFRDIEVVSPGFSFYLLPKRFLFLNYSVKFLSSNRYHYTYNEYRKTLNTTLSIYRNLSILEFLSFYPKIGYDFLYYNNDVAEHIEWNGSVKLRILKYLRFNFYQKYKKKIRGTLLYNYLGLSDIIKLSRVMSLKNSIELDILDGFKNYKNNFTPLNSRLDLRTKRFRIYLKNRYQIHPSRNLDTELFFKRGIFGISVFYNYSYPERFDIINTFDFRSGKWRFNFKIRYDYYYKDFSAGNLWYKEVSFVRDLHCWEMDFKYRERAEKKEFWVFFRIKAFPEKPFGLYYNRRDAIWSLKKK